MTLRWIRWMTIVGRNAYGYPSLWKRSLWHITSDGLRTACGKEVGPLETASEEFLPEYLPRTPPDNGKPVCRLCARTLKSTPEAE